MCILWLTWWVLILTSCHPEPMCNRTWDGWLCWDDTKAGVISEQHCPDYFQDFDPSGLIYGAFGKKKKRNSWQMFVVSSTPAVYFNCPSSSGVFGNRVDPVSSFHICAFAHRDGYKGLHWWWVLVPASREQPDMDQLHPLQWTHPWRPSGNNSIPFHDINHVCVSHLGAD